TAFTVNLERQDGEQYLSHVSTTLPSGLVGAIPKVAQCSEALANVGNCEPASAIGTANVTAGSGSKPLFLKGTAYLTGPYNGAPYGMEIEVPWWPVRSTSGRRSRGLASTSTRRRVR